MSEEGDAAVAEPTAPVADAPAPEKSQDAPSPEQKQPAAEPAADPAPETKPDPNQLPEGFDWRTLVKDEKARKTLGRFDNLDQAAKSYAELQAELGRRPKPIEKPGKDASPEQVAEYRKQIGVPEKAEDYLKGFTPPDVFNEATDRPVLDKFAEFAHEQNWSTDQAAAARDWYFDMRAHEFQEMNARAVEQQDAARHELTEELGGAKRFDMTLEAARRYAEEAAGTEAWANFANTPLADGTRVGDNPTFLRVMGQLARDAYGEDLTMVSGDRETAVKDLEARIKPLDEKMVAYSTRGGPKPTPQEYAEHQRLSAALSKQGKA